MTADEIQELFIRAAEVDRRLPNTEKPGTDRAMNHGYVHDRADINGWFSEEKEALRWAWLDPKNLRTNTNDVGLWEAAMEMMALVPDQRKRRALWAWSRAEAGGKAFAKWCKNVEDPGISRQLGVWRKNAAIESVLRAFARKPLQHNEKTDETDFTKSPETGHKCSIIGEVSETHWRAENAKPLACDFDMDLTDFDWAETQNQRRRERDAKRRQQAA